LIRKTLVLFMGTSTVQP